MKWAVTSLTFFGLAKNSSRIWAAVQSLEAILSLAARGQPGGVVFVNEPRGGLVLYAPGQPDPQVLYEPRV